MTATTLPAGLWQHDAALQRVVGLLGADNGQVRIVGGAVRDGLLGLVVADIDLATTLMPADVVARLTAGGVKAVPTGIAHGTVTAVADGRGFEVTTLRRDIATDGRRATVAYTDDWAEDASRRDFTINALYADPLTGAVTDPVGGLADLAARRVRFIGDAGQRIDEDHLRILRFFRFHARFGVGEPDPATLAVIAAKAATLRSLSRERIADELLKLLALPDPVAAVRSMLAAGLFAHIIPDIDAAAVARLDDIIVAEQRAILPPDAQRRLIALLPTDSETAIVIAIRLKLSNRLRKRLRAARADIAETDPRAIAYRLGTQAAFDRALIAGDAAPTLAALDRWQIPQLPISGGDLVAMGVPVGPDVARLLKAVERQWIAEAFPDAARTRAIAAALVPRPTAD